VICFPLRVLRKLALKEGFKSVAQRFRLAVLVVLGLSRSPGAAVEGTFPSASQLDVAHLY